MTTGTQPKASITTGRILETEHHATMVKHDPPQDRLDDRHSMKGQHYYRQDPRDHSKMPTQPWQDPPYGQQDRARCKYREHPRNRSVSPCLNKDRDYPSRHSTSQRPGPSHETHRARNTYQDIKHTSQNSVSENYRKYYIFTQVGI